MIVDLYVLDKLSNKYCLKTPLNVCNNYGYILLCKSQWWQEPSHTFQIFFTSQMKNYTVITQQAWVWLVWTQVEHVPLW